MKTLLNRARHKARHWNRVFGRFLDLFDGLEERRDCLLTGSMLFLIHRCVSNLEFAEPVTDDGPVDPLDSARSGDRFEGLDFEDAIEGAMRPHGEHHDVAAGELQILMVLAHGLVKSTPGSSKFADDGVGAEDLAVEYRALGSASGKAAVEVCTLLPSPMKAAWSAILEHAEKQCDPLKRLRLEMTLMRVIRALYAMAVGVRRAESSAMDEQGRWAWIAFTCGDACLMSAERSR